jgi:putative tryptophan/tyrosine transport system substrate-binding protein
VAKKSSPALGPSVAPLKTAASGLGIELVFFEARGFDELGPALDALAMANVDAVNVLALPILHNGHHRMMARIATERLPAIYQWPEYATEGALMGYGPRQALICRLVADLVDRVLKGAPTAELPVVQPTTFELAINVRAARELGLTIPSTVLARADELIE